MDSQYCPKFDNNAPELPQRYRIAAPLGSHAARIAVKASLGIALVYSPHPERDAEVHPPAEIGKLPLEKDDCVPVIER